VVDKLTQGYLKIGALGIALFTIFFGWSYSLGLPINTAVNRATADTAFIMIGMAYIIGPLAMKYKWFLTKLFYRKHLGVLGLTIAIAHDIQAILIFSLGTLISTRFLGFFFGALALIIFATLFIITIKPVMKMLGPKAWRRLQSWGYYGLLFAMVHVFSQDTKIWSWWLKNPFSIPPTSLFVVTFWFLTFAIRTYFYTYLGGKKHPTEKN